MWSRARGSDVKGKDEDIMGCGMSKPDYGSGFGVERIW